MASLQILRMIERSVTEMNRQVWLLQAEGADRAASHMANKSFRSTGVDSKDRTDRRCSIISSKVTE